MKIVWSKEIDDILKVGESLESSGVNNWALTKQQALNALGNLLKAQTAVLGGDVFIKKEGVFKPSYDNWYCNHLENELSPDFVVRSINIAKTYIETYGIVQQNEIYFILVPEKRGRDEGHIELTRV